MVAYLGANCVISCNDLTFYYGDVVAVDGITFSLSRGSIGALLGPNGAGKSTTLSMLSGLLRPTSGLACVAGMNVVSDRVVFRRNIGLLPQGLALFDELTIEEHLLLTGSVYGLSRNDTRRRCQELLEFFDLAEARQNLIRTCSYGMRKKTAFAMAVVHNPSVLLLDEPFETIDPVSGLAVQDLLVSMARNGTTILISSHLLAIAEQIADSLMIMKNGRIIWQAAPNALTCSLQQTYLDHVGVGQEKHLTWIL